MQFDQHRASNDNTLWIIIGAVLVVVLSVYFADAKWHLLGRANGQSRELGVTFDDGPYHGLTYHLDRFEVTKGVGDLVAPDGTTLLVVYYWLRNNQNETQEMSFNDFWIVTDDQKMFTPDSAAHRALLQAQPSEHYDGEKAGGWPISGMHIMRAEFQPGVPRNEVAVFELSLEQLKRHPLLVIKNAADLDPANHVGLRRIPLWIGSSEGEITSEQINSQSAVQTESTDDKAEQQEDSSVKKEETGSSLSTSTPTASPRPNAVSMPVPMPHVSPMGNVSTNPSPALSPMALGHGAPSLAPMPKAGIGAGQGAAPGPGPSLAPTRAGRGGGPSGGPAIATPPSIPRSSGVSTSSSDERQTQSVAQDGVQQISSADSSDTRDSKQAIAFQPYMAKVERLIKIHWCTPRVAPPGRAIAKFTVHKDGTVSDINLTESSGVQFLDESAVRAIRATAPFPPFPDGFSDESINITFSFDYNPSGSSVNRSY